MARMTMVAVPVPPVVEALSKVAAADEGTAMLLLRLATYEALCDEVDRIDDVFQADVRAYVAKRSAQALPRVLGQFRVAKASGDDTAVLEQAATVLGEFSLVGKYDPAEPRDRAGRWTRLGDALAHFATGANETKARTGLGVVTAQDKYDRAGKLGNALLRSSDPTTMGVGGALKLVGNLGPEAQTALEPGIRRTAYRYRGTERKPRRDVQREAALVAAAVDPRRPLSEADREELKNVVQESLSPQGPISPDAGALLGVKQSMTPDERRLLATSNYGVLKLVPQLPDKAHAEISLAAGKLPPSVGMMFDSHGNLVSEAQGYNGDHYLPFDLKNLKRLKGGSYVRTRTTGGLTDEDVYTGLLTGARKVTVVSNSGVYSLEFDPDLRGGRRYSDKARQMVDRYRRLTGAIGSGGLYQNKVPAEAMAQLRTEALRDAGGDATAAQTLIHDRLPKLQAKLAYTGMTEEQVEAEAIRRTEADPAKPQGARYAESVRYHSGKVREEQEATSVRRYRLDHEGYTAALKAVQQEFPFYVAGVEHHTLNDFLETHKQVAPGEARRPRGGTDLGYTTPGGLQPKRAKELGSYKTGRTAAPAAPVTPAATDTAPAAAAGAPAAPAATGLDTKIAAARKETALHLAGALTEGPIALAGVAGDALGGLPEPDLTLSQAAIAGPGPYFGKLVDDHGSAAKIASWLANSADDKELETFSRVLAKMPVMAKNAMLQGAEAYDEPIKQAQGFLERVRLLRTPWGTDEKNPPAIAEITALDTPEKLAAYGEANPEVVAAAKQAAADPDYGKKLFAEQRNQEKLLAWTDEADPPLGVQGSFGLAEGLRANPDHGDIKLLRTKEHGWALWRMHQLVGATSGSGDAVPLAKAHSRIVRHGPDSPLAKALLAKRRARR